MKKVLIITYYFPPIHAVATERFKGMAKYLPEFGWHPVFITPKLPGPVDPRYSVIQVPIPMNIFKKCKKMLGLDPEKKIQEHLRIPVSMHQNKKSITNRLENCIRSIVLFPNKNRGWCPHVIDAANELYKNEKFDAVISSSPLYPTHIIAKEIKNQLKTPWLADFRDLWTLGNFYRNKFILKYFEQKLEIKTLASADALATVSKPWADRLSTLVNKTHIAVIPNGFDSDDAGAAPLTEKFTITYTGLLHQGYQDPRLLFNALNELIDEGAIDPDSVQIRFYGPTKYWLDQDIKNCGMEKIAKQYGFIPRQDALEKQRQSQLLLILDWLDPNEVGFHTAKIFEYLLAHRPIIALGGGEGVVKELINTTKAGIHASDHDQIKKALIQCYNEYKTTGKVAYHGIDQEIDKYSRRQMAKKFADTLNLISKN